MILEVLMSLTNAQYDEIMKGYQTKQLKNQHIAQERLQTAYKCEPLLKKIDEQIASVSITSARKRLNGDTNAITELKKQLSELRMKKATLLKHMGLSMEYLNEVYTCADCKDTGYIDGKKCHCFTQQIIDLIYDQSNIKNILARENFSNFSYAYYSKELINPKSGLSSLESAKLAVKKCKEFIDSIDNFDQKPNNLLLYGDTGVGKTFLSNCVAKELLEKGKSVIYFTAFQLFDILSKGVFQKEEESIALHRNIYDCDLLIIDDLGTEVSNNFTSSQLFLCVNERLLRQKSTIISTNLSMEQLGERYSKRTVSRISDSYNLLKLFGKDIRIQKRRM